MKCSASYHRQDTAGVCGGHYGQGSGVAPRLVGHQPHIPVWNNQGFQGLTAQQQMLGTLEQQLQQAVTRAVIQALTGVVPGWAPGMGGVPHSS